MRINFSSKYHGRATSPRDGDRHQANWAGTGDQNILRGDFTGQHGVHGVAERIQSVCVALWDRWFDFPDSADGGNYVFGEAAVGVDADDFHILANVRLSHAAGAAVAAINVHLGAGEIGGLHRRGLGADFFDVPAEFVAEGHRRVDTGGRPTVPAVDMQIGAANRSSAHPHQTFYGPG